jgi:hypothetical protein
MAGYVKKDGEDKFLQDFGGKFASRNTKNEVVG